jgi:hypothetical protein
MICLGVLGNYEILMQLELFIRKINTILKQPSKQNQINPKLTPKTTRGKIQTLKNKRNKMLQRK